MFIDGVLQGVQEPGKYYFWKGEKTVLMEKVDMRRQQIDLAGQEIMTSDKVSMRINFVCHYRIKDVVRVGTGFKAFQEQLHILLQLMLREYIGSLKLDELLDKKEEVGAFVLNKTREKSGELGVEFEYAGVKDIILPGDFKEIMNLVLTAEKKAQANIITRREETASTRSLLNTARLMEDNPTLYKLKEMEYMERICDKIGSISFSSGGGNLMEHMASIIGSPSGKSEK